MTQAHDSSPGPVAARLSAEEAATLAAYTVELVQRQLPLTEGLNTLAADGASPAMRAAIAFLQARLAAGQSLEAAQGALGSNVPGRVGRLLAIAAQPGATAASLNDILAHERTIGDMTARFRQLMAYPLVLLIIWLVWLFTVTQFVVPDLLEMANEEFAQYDFTANAPVAHPYADLEQLVQQLPAFYLAGSGVLVVLGLLALSQRGRSTLSGLLAATPIVGPAWHARGVADLSGLLAVLLERQAPLAETLQLAADNVRDPAMQQVCRAIIVDVNAGYSLANAMARHAILPPSLVYWARWGERSGSLAAGLRTAAADYSERFTTRLQLAGLFVPMIIFGMIAAGAIYLARGFGADMFGLIQSLTYVYGAATQNVNPFAALRAPGIVGLLLVGWSLLTAARLWAFSSNRARGGAAVLGFAGLMLIAIGLLACSLLLLGPQGFLLWILVLVVWARAAWRVREANRYALWGAMTLAADRQAPLLPLMQAFAEEFQGGTAARTRKLVKRLAEGGDLVSAIVNVPSALPRDAALAAAVGQSTGDLHGAMRALAEGRTLGRPPVPTSLLWLALFIPVAMMIATFMLVKIAPSMVKIFEDFDSSLPPLTILVISVANSGLVLPLCLFGLLAMLLVWLQWRGTLPPLLPGLSRVVRWTEMQRVLRFLSVAARREVPFPAVLTAIGDHYPLTWLRGRMRSAAVQVNRGDSWQASLQQTNLLTPRDVALLNAAERNGNLPWVLDQLADSFRRRADLLVRAWSEASLPVLVAVVGLAVALFCCAWFLPLAALIINLS